MLTPQTSNMITSLATTHPREIAILCSYTHAVIWAEYYIRSARDLARTDPLDTHLEVLDSLVELYCDQADKYVPHIDSNLMIEITRSAMRGEFNLRDAQYIEREGVLAFKRAAEMGI